MKIWSRSIWSRICFEIRYGVEFVHKPAGSGLSLAAARCDPAGQDCHATLHAPSHSGPLTQDSCAHSCSLKKPTFAQAKSIRLIPVAHSPFAEPIFARRPQSLGEPLPPREEAERRTCHARQHPPTPLPGLSRLDARQPELDTRHRRNQQPRATVQRPQTWPRM